MYPKPMFEFGERRTICLDGMKKAYQVGLYGDDPKVIDGSWRELFDDSAEGPTEGKSFDDAMTHEADEDEKVQNGPDGGDESDGAVEEDESGAKEKGGETKDGDAGRGTKRKVGQATLDKHIKKSKK